MLVSKTVLSEVSDLTLPLLEGWKLLEADGEKLIFNVGERYLFTVPISQILNP
jgi:hypothetical protein